MNADTTSGPWTSTDRQDEPWRRLHRYWLSKHVDGRPPARSDIDPITEIPRLVANMMLIDATEDGYIYRFVGTEVVNQTGQDMTGQHVGVSRKYASVQAQWTAELDFVRLNQKPRLVTYRFEGQAKARQLVLILPLHTPDGATVKMLAGSFFDGDYPRGLQLGDLSAHDISG